MLRVAREDGLLPGMKQSRTNETVKNYCILVEAAKPHIVPLLQW